MSIDLKKEREKIVSGSANVFYDEEVKLLAKDTHLTSFMEKEMDKVWAKVWNIGGSWSNEIPEPGDYITHEIGRESIFDGKTRRSFDKSFS